MATIPQISTLTNFINGKGWFIIDKTTFKPVASFDSFSGWNYEKQNLVLDYAVEKGQFVSYNKQRRPYQATATLIKGGLSFYYDREQFLKSLNDYCDAAKLVSIITPNGIITSATLHGLTYTISQKETPGMLIVRLTIKEAIESASALINDGKSIINYSNPNDAPSVKTGMSNSETGAFLNV